MTIHTPNAEKLFLNYTIGAFWDPKTSPAKYKDAQSWSDYIWAAYSAGLFGVNDDGTLKVKILKEAITNPIQSLGKIDKTNLYFAAILGVAFPFAPSLLTNIKTANFGKPLMLLIKPLKR